MRVVTFEIPCTRCGMKDSVPFQPDERRPLYCHNCYREVLAERGAKPPSKPG